ADVGRAHRDEVDADAVVRAVLDRELELRADAVGARNEDGLAIAFRHAEQPAEPAQTADDLGAQRALHGGLDSLDERVARVDVDARVLVSEARIGRHVAGPWGLRRGPV